MLGSAVRLPASFIALALLFVSAAQATKVTLPYRGMTLNGTLEVAQGKSLADGVILMVHGSLSHKSMGTMRHFRQLFGQNGYSTLAINLGLNVDNRQNDYDCAIPSTHKYDDALDEIGAWLDWLTQQGAKRVVPFGFSRGGHQAAWFAAERVHATVESVVLLAPLIPSQFVEPAAYQRRFGKPLQPMLDRAEALVKAGTGKTLIEKIGFLNCEETSVTAESFLSYYTVDPKRDLVPLLRRIKQPTFVVVAGGDTIVRDLDNQLAPIADGKRLRMASIPGADHFFRDLYGEDAMDEIVKFLSVR